MHGYFVACRDLNPAATPTGPERLRVSLLPSLRHSGSVTAMRTLLQAGPDGRACPAEQMERSRVPALPESDSLSLRNRTDGADSVSPIVVEGNPRSAGADRSSQRFVQADGGGVSAREE